MPLFPVPSAKCAQFVYGDFAVAIGVRLLKVFQLSLISGLKFGPTDRTIPIDIQSTQFVRHSWMPMISFVVILYRLVLNGCRGPCLGPADFVRNGFSAPFSAYLRKLRVGDL